MHSDPGTHDKKLDCDWFWHMFKPSDDTAGPRLSSNTVFQNMAFIKVNKKTTVRPSDICNGNPYTGWT